MEAASLAEKEFGVRTVIIKKTSSYYTKEKYPPPCPSVLVNGGIVARNDIVPYEALKTALFGDSDIKEGQP